MPTNPILFQRGVILAKIEAVFGTDVVPTQADNSFLVRDPQFTPDITQLDRNANMRNSLSPLATVVGRKVARMSFAHEARSNGNTDGTLSPRLGDLLRACGMQQVQVTGASGTIGTAAAADGNTGTITFAKTTAFTGGLPRTVTITATTGGASATAEVTVSAPAVGDLAAYSVTGVVVTDSTAIALPNGAEITPTVGTSLDVGDVWTVELTPAGYEYTPVSESFDSVTLYAYFDGLLHKMTGCVGTVNVEAVGGDYGIFNFDFTGNYVDPVDAAMPTNPTYESTSPQQVESSALTLNNSATLIASRFSIDLANQVDLREDVNQQDSYAGARISGRQPTVSFDPEMVLEATFDFWAKMKAGTSMPFSARVGTTKGNIIRLVCPATQLTNIAYQNRNNTRVYDVTLNASGEDDEVKIAFN